MATKKRLIILAAMLLPLTGAIAQTKGGVVGTSSADRYTLTDYQQSQIDADNLLAMKILKSYNRRNLESNFIFSATGISTALGLAINASQGETKKELIKMFGRDFYQPDTNSFYSFLTWSLNYKTGFKFGLDNSVWIYKNFDVNPWLTDAIAEPYIGSIHTTTAESLASDANSWIKEKSGGRFSQTIPHAVTNGGGVVITNTAWFDATWRSKFFPINGYIGKFNPGTDTKPYEVEYLGSVMEFPHYDDIQNGVEYAEFTFADQSPVRAASMLVIMPHKARNLNKILEEHLTLAKLSDIIKKLHPRRLKVAMPIFSIESQQSLKPLFEESGVNRLFSKEDGAGFAGDKGLSVDEILHTTSISIDGEGCYAMPIDLNLKESTQKFENMKLAHFNMNKPFVFIIRDRNTGAILFAGKVVEVTP